MSVLTECKLRMSKSNLRRTPAVSRIHRNFWFVKRMTWHKCPSYEQFQLQCAFLADDPLGRTQLHLRGANGFLSSQLTLQGGQPRALESGVGWTRLCSSWRSCTGASLFCWLHTMNSHTSRNPNRNSQQARRVVLWIFEVDLVGKRK